MEPLGGVSQAREGNSIAQSGNRKRSFSRVVPEQGKKRVNYGKGDARRIMEEAVSLCEAMSLGYEVVLHGRRRSSAAHRYVEASSDSRRRNDPDADLDDSQVAYIARSKRDVAEHFGVAWSTMQPRLVGKIGTKPSTPGRTVSMPDDVELELYNHIVWMCDHGYPVSWDGIKEVAWQLGRICHMPDFVATPQWLKKFKGRFPDLETRYNPQLRNHRAYKRMPGDPGYGDAPGEERNSSQVGVAWAELGIGSGLSMAPGMPTDLQATTPGGYLAVQRARAEAEAEASRRRQEGILTGPMGGAAPVHHDPRLHLRPGAMVPLPRHVVGYPSGQMEMTPRYSPLQDPVVRGPSVWGPGGAGVVMSPPLSHDEMQHQQQKQTQQQKHQQQQPQQHMNFAVQQVGTTSIGSQRLMNVPGQHLVNNTIGAGLGPGHLDGSGAHHHALGTPTVARSQAISSMAQFAPMPGQGIVMGVGNGCHSQQANAGAQGMLVFPSGSMAGARRLVAPTQANGHAMGMTGPWQAHAPWPEQLVGPWQHPGMSQAPGLPPLQQQQQQQQLQQIISTPGNYQGYHSSTLDPSEAQTRGLSPGVTLPSTQSSSGRSTFATRHDFEVSTDQSAGLGSSLGLGLGLGGQLHAAQDEPQVLPSASFGIGGQGSPSLPLEMHQPKREDTNSADSRSRMNIREGPAPITGTLEGLGGGGSGGGYKGNGDGTGSSGKVSLSSSYSPAFPTFMPSFCGPVPPGSPRNALVGGVSYPTHLGMGIRGANEEVTKGPPTPGSGGRNTMSSSTTVAGVGNSREGRDPSRHQDSSVPLHYGGAPDNRSHTEKAKVKRWIVESNGQPSGPPRGVESGNSGTHGRVVERLA